MSDRQSNRVITDATELPITLEEAKAQCKVLHDFEDAHITDLIHAARRYCQGLMNRSVMSHTRRLTLDYFPCVITLRFPPVISVTSIAYIDANGTQQTLSASNYLVSTASEPGRVTPAYGYSWPSTQGRMDAVVVNYTAGYVSAADVPQPIKQAIKLWVEFNRLGTYDEQTEQTIRNLLASYEVGEYG